MEEIWKDIADFEELYQVSNLGRIKSKRYNKLLRPCANEKGYLRVSLTKNHKIYTKKVHRLVAQAFIPNTDNKSEINHINHIRNDNRVSNLEWTNHADNMIGVKCGCKGNNGKKVALFIDGVKVAEYKSISQASKQTGIDYKALRYVLDPKNKKLKWVLI